MTWDQELDLNTCKSTKFDIGESIKIKVYSTKTNKHTFIHGIIKVEVVLIDTTTYVVEEIDISYSINDENDNEHFLEITDVMTVEKWQNLTTANNQCSKEGHNILDNEDRKFTFDAYLRPPPYGACDNVEFNNDRIHNLELETGDRNWKGSGWYRVMGKAGTKLFSALSGKLEAGKCNAEKPGWLNGAHPEGNLISESF